MESLRKATKIHSEGISACILSKLTPSFGDLMEKIEDENFNPNIIKKLMENDDNENNHITIRSTRTDEQIGSLTPAEINRGNDFIRNTEAFISTCSDQLYHNVGTKPLAKHVTSIDYKPYLEDLDTHEASLKGATNRIYQVTDLSFNLNFYRSEVYKEIFDKYFISNVQINKKLNNIYSYLDKRCSKGEFCLYRNIFPDVIDDYDKKNKCIQYVYGGPIFMCSSITQMLKLCALKGIKDNVHHLKKIIGYLSSILTIMKKNQKSNKFLIDQCVVCVLYNSASIKWPINGGMSENTNYNYNLYGLATDEGNAIGSVIISDPNTMLPTFKLMDQRQVHILDQINFSQYDVITSVDNRKVIIKKGSIEEGIFATHKPIGAEEFDSLKRENILYTMYRNKKNINIKDEEEETKQQQQQDNSSWSKPHRRYI